MAVDASSAEDDLFRWAAKKVAETDPAVGSFLLAAKPVWKGPGQLEVQGFPPMLAEREEASVWTGALKAALASRLNRPVELTFVPLDHAMAEDVARRQKAEDESRMRQAQQADAASDSHAVLLGRAFRGESLPLDRLPEQSNALTVEGTVFKVERRTGRGSDQMLIWLTDHRSSLVVRIADRPGKPIPLAEEAVPIGTRLRVRGSLTVDRSGEPIVAARDIERLPVICREEAVPGRVELHLHTRMSAMDGVADLSSTFARALQWDFAAVAITDHGVVQAFPEAAQVARGKVRPLYGVEAYVVDDLKSPVQRPREGRVQDLPYVVVDLETTGLLARTDAILEIGAVRIGPGGDQSFHTMVRPPSGEVPAVVQQLTGITPEMVADAPTPDQALAKFWQFAAGAAIVAHNAPFDVGFLRAKGGAPEPLTVVDTLALSRALVPELKNHRLDTVARELGVVLERHHRADADAAATAEILRALFRRVNAGKATEVDIATLREAPTASRPLATTVIARTPSGLLDLYSLITESHLQHFRRVPRMLKSRLAEKRAGLLIGAPVVRGELIDGLLEAMPNEEFIARAQFYDYLEVLPPDLMASALKGVGLADEAAAQAVIRAVLDLGRRADRSVVAVSDAHLLDPEDHVFRDVLRASQGDDEGLGGAYLRTAGELMDQFAFLGEETARELVIDAPARIAAQVETFDPLPDGTASPVLEGAAERVDETARGRARELFGEPLPEEVASRLSRELKAIVGNGFSSIYWSAALLVKKCYSDGYLVGSRGSVGSSLVAHLLGITEVNPLPPHYRCPSCRTTKFVADAASGYDLEAATCECGTPFVTDGQDIRFETFLGFEGDKVPDIDLNFPGEYQPVIHRYADEVFGGGNVFRAGTISTVAERTAYGLVKGYLRQTGESVRGAELDRLASGVAGTKRTTGQHPGGLMIIPQGRDVHEFTPLQRPADDPGAQVLTTHFDYHAISGRLLKLDLLGHHDPTTLRLLEEYTGEPAREVPLTDPRVLSLFSSTQALGVSPQDIGSEVGTLGLPEFGTRFVRAMLVEVRPKTFADLVRVSGLSHGTDVWANNAQDIVRQGEADLTEVISTRDDVMIFLMRKGLAPRTAFTIMERVRHGKGLRPEDEAEMRAAGVPDWYIGSCGKISYLFPKAHAVAYVTMACRIAYFKVHHPEAFYAAHFTIRAEECDASLLRKGSLAVAKRMREIEQAGNEATAKDRAEHALLEVVREFYARGLRLRPVDLYESAEDQFRVTSTGLLPPLVSLQGLGRNAAAQLGRARAEGPFQSIEDLRVRARLQRPVVDLLAQEGCLEGLPATSQLTLF